MGNRWGNSGNSVRLYFRRLQNHCRWWLQPWNQKTLAPWKKSYDKPRRHIKKQRHYLDNKGPSSQRFGFSSSHVSIWELDHKESWVPQNWYFWTVVLEKTLESPLDCEEIKPVNSKGIQTWLFIRRNDAETEAPILWYLMQRANSLEKTLMLGKIEGRRRRGWQRTRGWMPSLTQWAWIWASSRDGEGQGSLVCCSSWGHKESDMTERLNNNR